MLYPATGHHFVIFGGYSPAVIYVTPAWGDGLDRFYAVQFIPAWAIPAQADQYGKVQKAFPDPEGLRLALRSAAYGRGPEWVSVYSPDGDYPLWRVFELDGVNPRPIRQWVVQGPRTTPMTHPEPQSGWIHPAEWGQSAPYWVSPSGLTFPQHVPDHRRPHWWPSA